MKKLFFATGLALAVSLHAQTIIPIANASFESPSTGTTAAFGGGNWVNNPGITGAIASMSFLSPYYNGGVTAPDGLQVGYLNASGSDNYIYQDVGANFVTGTTYTFSAYFGRRNDVGATAVGRLELYTSTGTLLATTGGISPTVGASFLYDSVSYVATGAENGLGICIRIVNEVDATQLNFDNVQLTAVPEPATYAALLGSAVLGLALFRHRLRPFRAIHAS